MWPTNGWSQAAVRPPSSLSPFISPQPKDPPMTSVAPDLLQYLASAEPQSPPSMILQQDIWPRRNPNWGQESPHCAHIPSPTGPPIPTVLANEDGHAIKYTGLMDNKPEDEAESGFDVGAQCATHPHVLIGRIAELSGPMVSILNAKWEDIPNIRKTAARLGVHSAVVHRGAPHKRTVGMGREHSCWVILGQNAELVDEVVDAQQMGMPGVVASDAEMATPLRVVTFFQLMIVGLIGGSMVVFMLFMVVAVL